MIIRLFPPAPHPTILYGVSFPHVLPLPNLGPTPTVPAAWSSQLQLLTSFLHLDPPSNVHMLDRAVGLVALVDQVTMDVPQKEFVLKFVDGRVIHTPMNSDCVRMLLSVVLDVKGCSEPESQRNSIEGSACTRSTVGSAEDIPSSATSPKPSKPGKHKKQRSLLFSLISLLVPKSLSLSTPPLPSTAPPRTPLPPLPSGRVTSPVSFQRTNFASEDPEVLRKRARATLIDVWRRHVVTAVPLQHMPAGGYIEWILIAMASKVRAEVESYGTTNSHLYGATTISGGVRHKNAQSEGRMALDFGDRSDDYGSDQWRCRAPSPCPGMSDMEDADRIVYPRREQADEWGVRYVPHSTSTDEVDVFAVEYSGHNDSLLGEQLTLGDDWDDAERLTFELSRFGPHAVLGVDGRLPSFDEKHLHPEAFCLDYDEEDSNRLADTAFDISRCPLTPTDVNEDEQSDDSQMSLRTPEDGEDIPLILPRQTTYSTPRRSPVSRVGSSRPRPRNASAQFSDAHSPSVQAPRPIPLSSSSHYRDYEIPQVDEVLASQLEFLDQIYATLELVRGRAREEGWRRVRATSIGANNGWMDVETERSLEMKAKRRAWSSGIKISAPYCKSRSAARVWDGSPSTPRLPMPPGLPSPAGILRVHEPIVPTGLSLGVPLRSSPLALYSWSADHAQRSTPSKYGVLSSWRGMETIVGKKRSRVTLVDNVSKLFPVCEEDGEDLFEPVDVNGVGFPQTVPVSVAPEEPDYSLTEGPASREDDPFSFCPSVPRTRTKSMYIMTTTSSTSSPVPPLFRPSTPPPSYQAEDVFAEENHGEGKLDASALLLQPLSPASVSTTQLPPPRPPLVSNLSSIPRPRAISLPTPKIHPNAHQTCRSSHHRDDERCEDLSQAYALPPPEGPMVVSAVPAPHEEYPRYAHVRSPVSPSKKNASAPILPRMGKEVVFEQGGSEFTVGIEVALGRAEEGRVVW